MASIYFFSFQGKKADGAKAIGNGAVRLERYPSMDMIIEKANAGGLVDVVVLGITKFDNDDDYKDFIGSHKDKFKVV